MPAALEGWMLPVPRVSGIQPTAPTVGPRAVQLHACAKCFASPFVNTSLASDYPPLIQGLVCTFVSEAWGASCFWRSYPVP